MPVNIGKLELEIAKKIGCSTTSDPADLQLLATSIKQLKNTPIDYVSTYASLPAPSASNKGKMYFVDSECTVYWNTGCSNIPLKGSTYYTTIYGFGHNGSGQLGNGITAVNCQFPTTVVCGNGTWCSVSGGYNHSSALKTDGTLWVWGSSNYGQLGNNTASYSYSPVTTAGAGTTWCQVSAGGYYSTFAIKTDGTLWAWGRNNFGQLGAGNITDYSSPVTVAGGGNTWNKISGGYSPLAIKTDGTLWTWGYNSYGQLTNGNTTNQSSPITIAGGGTNWCKVPTTSGSNYHNASIKSDGTLWGWGYNISGQLGDGTLTAKSSPVTTAGGGTNWCQLSIGNGNAYSTLAIKTDGTLWVWGSNSYGTLGTGNTTGYSSPVTVAGGGTTWCQVSSGSDHSSAIKTDGTLWLWGRNDSGVYQLGNGNATCYSSPVTTINGGTNWCLTNRTPRGGFAMTKVTY